MPPIEPSGLARLPMLFLARAPELGLDRAELMRHAGLTEADLEDPDARIPIRKLWDMCHFASEKAGDPWLPVRVASSTSIRSFGLVGYTMANSGTVRQALSRLARYSRIVTEAVRVHFIEDDTGGRLDVEGASIDRPGSRIGPDTRLAFLIAAVRELTGKDVTPTEVRLPYACPSGSDELATLLRATLTYDSPLSSVSYARPQLDLEIRGADETLGGYLVLLSNEVLRGLPDPDSFKDQVRRAMWAALGDGQPELSGIAAKLAVSARTLQRRLRDEGTSYGEVLDGLRREFAIRLLKERQLAVYEIAFLLGYAEPSTFHRAFRRWTGLSPQQFRRGGR